MITFIKNKFMIYKIKRIQTKSICTFIYTKVGKQINLSKEVCSLNIYLDEYFTYKALKSFKISFLIKNLFIR